MYGLSDHLKAMPFTALSAFRQGSSRYSARMAGAGSIERTFEQGVARLTLPLPTGPRHVHCYLLDGGEGRLLVDTGLGLPGDEVAWDGLEVDSIVLTHMHPDHVGGAQSAAEATRASVHQLALDYDQCVRVWGSADWPERMAGRVRSPREPAGRARERADHHRRRLAETQAALAAEPRTGYDVSIDLFGDDLSPPQRRFAVAETLSHIEHLVARDQAARGLADGSLAYTAA